MRTSTALAVAATLGSAAAQTYFGFNSGATDDTGKAKTQKDFEREFEAARNLEGAPGEFNVFRLYTNIQSYATTPIEAFPAAIATKTKLLLGVWASGVDNIDNELDALLAAVKEHGTDLTDLVVGLSIGSEDMYRVSEIGIKNKSGPGSSAETIIKFIKDAREKLKDTPLSDVQIGHVDTWNAWANSSNTPVIDEVDWIGINSFPFYEAEKANDISNARGLLQDALDKTDDLAKGKPVWMTETGWPYTGPAFGAADATVDNAESYWQDVGCELLFGKRNVFWYTLRDSNPDNEVKFAITDNLSPTPRYNLTCPAAHERPQSGNNNNSTESDDSSSSNSNSTSSDNEDSNGNSGSGSGSGSGNNSSSSSGSATTSSGAPQSTGAGVSLTTSMTMVFSVALGLAVYAL